MSERTTRQIGTKQKLQWMVVLVLVWIGLTNSVHYQEILAGIVVSLVLVWLAVPKATMTADRPWSVIGLLRYMPIFLKNLVQSNLDVAKRVLDPRLPVNPGVVKVHTRLVLPYQRLLLANSITLTPGTVTLEMEGDAMFIHWIDVTDCDPTAAGHAIKEEMEQAIDRI